MMNFYYSVHFIIDTLIYATIFIICLNMVLKKSATPTDEEKKRKHYLRLLFALVAAPLFTGFLYSAFGFNLGMIFSKSAVFVFGSIFALVLIIIFFKVFKKFPSVKGWGWLLWILPVVIVCFAILFLEDFTDVRNYIIYGAVIFWFLFLFIRMALGKSDSIDNTTSNEIRSRRRSLRDTSLSEEDRSRINSEIEEFKRADLLNKRKTNLLKEVQKIEEKIIRYEDLLTKEVENRNIAKKSKSLLSSVRALKGILNELLLSAQREGITDYDTGMGRLLARIINLDDTINNCKILDSNLDSKKISINTICSEIIKESYEIIVLLKESNNLTLEINSDLKKDHETLEIKGIRNKTWQDIWSKIKLYEEEEFLDVTSFINKINLMAKKDNTVLTHLETLQTRLTNIQTKLQEINDMINASVMPSSAISSVLKNSFLFIYVTTANKKTIEYLSSLKNIKKSEHFCINYRNELFFVFKLLENNFKNLFKK